MSDSGWGYAAAGILALLGIGGIILLASRASGQSRGRGSLSVVGPSSAGGGWSNEETVETERDGNGFIIREVVHRSVVQNV